MERKFRLTTCLFEEFLVSSSIFVFFPFLRLRKYRIELQPYSIPNYLIIIFL